MDILKQLFHLFRRIGEVAALDRLHDGDKLSVFSGRFIVGAGGDLGVLPVRIIDLHLDEIHLRMLRQQLVQQFRPGVEGKTQVADQSLFLLLPHKVPEMQLLITLVVVFHQRMQQVVIEVSRAGPLQTGGKLLACGLLCRGHHGVQLGGKGKAVPRMALYQGFPDRSL